MKSRTFFGISSLDILIETGHLRSGHPNHATDWRQSSSSKILYLEGMDSQNVFLGCVTGGNTLALNQGQTDLSHLPHLVRALRIGGNPGDG